MWEYRKDMMIGKKPQYYCLINECLKDAVGIKQVYEDGTIEIIHYDSIKDQVVEPKKIKRRHN
jgi:hypothetical protein